MYNGLVGVAKVQQKGGVRVLKFKGYCAERKIKQSEIADLLQITVQTVNRKLNGAEPFTLEQVKTLCKHYEISADEYFV